MKEKEFESMSGSILKVVTNRSNLQFVLPDNEVIGDHPERVYLFDKKTHQKFVNYLLNEGNSIWKDFTPKEVNSLGSDYYDYYDKKYDNNGYLSIDGNKAINITACWNAESRLYQFTKAKLQSFVYDLLNLLDN